MRRTINIPIPSVKPGTIRLPQKQAIRV